MAMLYSMVSIRDRAAETFQPPFCVPTTNVAVRTFSNEVNRIAHDNPLHTAAEDFELYFLGMYDDTTGAFIPEMVDLPDGSKRAQPKLLCTGKDVKRVVN